MAAVPIYVWNGSAWQETGPTIPANPIKYQASAPSSPSTGDIWVDSDGDVTTGSQQFQRFRFVAVGGETTISGADANGAVLAYTAGLEQVVLNGAVLVRGHDYLATTGTTITGLSPALVASDVLEVFSFIAFTVANTYTQAQVDGLVSAAPGLKLIVPTSVDNGTIGASGAVTFSAVSSISLNDVFSATYDSYLMIWSVDGSTTATTLSWRARVSSTDNSSSNYSFGNWGNNSESGSIIFNQGTLTTSLDLGAVKSGSEVNQGQMFVHNPFSSSKRTQANGSYVFTDTNYRGRNFAGSLSVTTSYTGFSMLVASGTITGTVRVYGYKN